MSTKTIEIPREEAVARVTALANEIQQLVASKKELADIVLDALLSCYVTVADATGRLHEVPPVLLSAAQGIASTLVAAQSTKH